MANLINLEQVSKSFGIQPLLDGVSLGVHEGERIGVVGLNGGGKTTLLEVLAGIEEPDSGRVSRVGGLRMAVVTQRGVLPPGRTVRRCGARPRSAIAEHEWAADARIRSVLAGIGIDAARPGHAGRRSLRRRAPPGRAGRRAGAGPRPAGARRADQPPRRRGRAVAGRAPADPAQRARGRHPRPLVPRHRRHPHLGGRRRQGGELRGRLRRLDLRPRRAARQADAAEERRRNLARKELAWLRRGAQARTSKPRYRVEAAEALIADVPPPRDSVALAAFAQRRLGAVVIELEDAHV